MSNLKVIVYNRQAWYNHDDPRSLENSLIMGITVKSNSFRYVMNTTSVNALNNDMHAPNALPPLEQSSLTPALKCKCFSKIRTNLYL